MDADPSRRLGRRLTVAALLAAGLAAAGGTAHAQVAQADLALTMTAPATVLAAGTYDITATITNNGPDAALSTEFGITLTPSSAGAFTAAVPSVGGSCNVAADAVLCTSLGDLANGATLTVTVTVQVAADAAVGTALVGDGETFTSNTNVQDPDGTDNQALVTTNVVAPPPPSTTTTTTTLPATTTTAAATTTAPATTAAPTTTAAAGLPQTGSSDTGLMLAAAALLAGGALVIAARRSRPTDLGS
ncbi:MAG: LPXTG cell wall anchor domain-containing protein [Ilumatobacteraceae bacterium]|nr:LPXTG cell wall anchor domain-containing protein [Ilumatobacteraceae bacterium]